ncbi:hypothetical protein [Corallococcus sp. CA047B]|uniref:hypothetical protein n=1 Tax=Corallococcus sp. CA047B TaxID=2316729 RepID=UPI0011C36697|nr:hypothetical protein [Corallococcus sp. CA047B]
MLRVKTSLKPSLLHGLDLFAEERIPRGTVVWLYEAGLALRFWPEDVEAMAPEARALLARDATSGSRGGSAPRGGRRC